MSRRLLYLCTACDQLVHHQYCAGAPPVHFQCSTLYAVARQAANEAARQAARQAARKGVGCASKQADEKEPSSLVPCWSLAEFRHPSGEGFATARQPAEPMNAPFAVAPETP